MNFIEQWIVPPEVAVSASLYIVTAICSVMIVSISKGGFGGGVGMIAVPLMFQVAPTTFVLGLWLPILIACDIATIRQYPKEWRFKAIAPLAPGMLAGIALATLLLGSMNTDSGSLEAKQQEGWLKLAVAMVAFVFVAMKYVPGRSDRKEKPEAWKPTWTMGLLIGIPAGIATMIAHAAGPLTTMFLLPQQMDKRTYVGTCGRYYFFFNSLKIPFLIAIGLISMHTFKYGLWLMLISPLGVMLGSWLNRKLNSELFVRLIYFFLFFASLKLGYDWWRTAF